MKREFLQSFTVGDQPLPKEVIDAIMAENGRDIEAAKKKGAEPFADYESIKEQLQTAKDGLKAFEGVDVGDLQNQVADIATHSLALMGKGEPVTMEVLGKVCQTLHCDVEDIVEYIQEED